MKTLLISFLLLAWFVPNLSAQMVVIDGLPRDTSFNLHDTYLKERKYRPYIKPVYASLPQGVKAYEQVTYKTVTHARGNHELKMNIYRPDDDRRYPALLMIHGGGWNSGNLSLQVPMAQQIATRGYVTIPVEYRLIPEALFPAGVDDLEDAISWIYVNADKYGIDRERIAVSGCSAGGQLSMLLGMKNVSGHVKAVINMDGTSSFLAGESVARAQAARDKGEILPIDAVWLGGTYEEKTINWEDASPLLWISEKSAPVCFINSSIPRFHDGRDDAIARLAKLGKYTEVHTHEDTPHPFWFFHPWFEKTVQYAASFLDYVLKGEKK